MTIHITTLRHFYYFHIHTQYYSQIAFTQFCGPFVVGYFYKYLLMICYDYKDNLLLIAFPYKI